VLVHVSLKFLIGSSLSLQAFWEVSWIASWDRLLLNKCFFGTGSLCVLKIVLSSDNVMVNTKIWNKVVLIVFIHVSLELLVSCGFSLQAFWEISTVACWDWFLLN
jgi:hypothetical protein